MNTITHIKSKSDIRNVLEQYQKIAICVYDDSCITPITQESLDNFPDVKHCEFNVSCVNPNILGPLTTQVIDYIPCAILFESNGIGIGHRVRLVEF